MESKFLVNADRFAIGDTRLDDQIDAFTGNWTINKNGNFTGIGVGVDPFHTHKVKSREVFITHNGEVYIRASAIESGTIKMNKDL